MDYEVASPLTVSVSGRWEKRLRFQESSLVKGRENGAGYYCKERTACSDKIEAGFPAVSEN